MRAQVLSIADFMHASRKDALVVKALQRRSEAYRALQQTSRAVEDLQAGGAAGEAGEAGLWAPPRAAPPSVRLLRCVPCCGGRRRT